MSAALTLNVILEPLFHLSLCFPMEQLRQDAIGGLQQIKVRDPCLRVAASTLTTGRKWKPATAVAEARYALRHWDVVRHIQYGRGGLGLGATTPSWQKATPSERRHLVVEKVRHQEEVASCAKVSQAQQDRWTRWDSIGRSSHGAIYGTWTQTG